MSFCLCHLWNKTLHYLLNSISFLAALRRFCRLSSDSVFLSLKRFSWNTHGFSAGLNEVKPVWPDTCSTKTTVTPNGLRWSTRLPRFPWMAAGLRCRWDWGPSFWCSSRPPCRCQVYRSGSWPGRPAQRLYSSRTCSLKTRRSRWTRRCRSWPSSHLVWRNGNLKPPQTEQWLLTQTAMVVQKEEDRAVPLPFSSPGRGFLVVSED